MKYVTIRLKNGAECVVKKTELKEKLQELGINPAACKDLGFSFPGNPFNKVECNDVIIVGVSKKELDELISSHSNTTDDCTTPPKKECCGVIFFGNADETREEIIKILDGDLIIKPTDALNEETLALYVPNKNEKPVLHYNTGIVGKHANKTNLIKALKGEDGE